VIVIQRTPDHGRRNRKEAARREFNTADRTVWSDRTAAHGCAVGVTYVPRLGVIGFVDAAVVTGKHRLVGRAVVVWMERDDVVVCVNELRITVVWWSAVALEPPVRCHRPVNTTIVRAEQVN